FGLRDPAKAGSWFSRGGASTGLLLMAMPKLTFSALALLLGLSWIVSALSAIAAAIGQRGNAEWVWSLIDGIVNLVIGLAIAVQWPVSGIVSIGLFVGLHYLSAGWSILMGAAGTASPAPQAASGEHPDNRLGLPPHPYVASLLEELTLEE